MAVILSKHCADMLAGGRAVVNEILQGTTFSYVDGGAGNDQIADSGNGLAIFHVGDMITVEGSTSNDGTYEILAVAAGTIDVGTGLLTTEAAGDQTTLASARGHSLLDIFRHSVIRLYSGAQPASAEAVETGDLLLQISSSGGAFVGGADANGLLFDSVTDGVLSKDGSQTWSDTGIATGNIGWGRLYDNAFNTGADAGEAYNRIDFAVAAAGSDLNMAIAVVIGNVKTIDTFNLTIPLSA